MAGNARVRAALAAGLLSCALLAGCGGGAGPVGDVLPGAGSGDASGETSGPAYHLPETVEAPAYSAEAALSQNGASLDASRASEGVVFATAAPGARCKLQVASGDMSYNYDLPEDGSPVAAPLNMGSGAYVLRVMQNVGGTSYVEVARAEQSVELSSDLAPFLRPGVFCRYDAGSACVAKARELAASAANQGDVCAAVFNHVIENVSYDPEKAASLADVTGYVPDPDETLTQGRGICFDYASLCAAMLRSLGIPCQVVTGYVDPDDLYHAWNMVYIDGSWHTVRFSVDPNTWSRVDATFAASGSLSTVGSGTGYRDRYVY